MKTLVSVLKKSLWSYTERWLHRLLCFYRWCKNIIIFYYTAYLRIKSTYDKCFLFVASYIKDYLKIFKRIKYKKIKTLNQLKLLLDQHMKEIFFKKQYLKNLKNKFVLLNSSLNDLFNYKVWHSDSAVANQLEFQEIEFFFTFNMLFVILSTLVFVLWALCVLLTSFSEKSNIRAKELDTSTVLEELLRGSLVFVISVGPSLLLHMLCVILLGQEVNLEVAANQEFLPSEDPNYCCKQQVLENDTEQGNGFTLGVELFLQLFYVPDESALPAGVDAKAAASNRPYLADISAQDVDAKRPRYLAAIAETESKAALKIQRFEASAEEDADRAAVHEAGEMIIETLAEEAAAGDSVNAESAVSHRPYLADIVARDVENARPRTLAAINKLDNAYEFSRQKCIIGAMDADARFEVESNALNKILPLEDHLFSVTMIANHADASSVTYDDLLSATTDMIANHADADASAELEFVRRQYVRAAAEIDACAKAAEDEQLQQLVEEVNALEAIRAIEEERLRQINGS